VPPPDQAALNAGRAELDRLDEQIIALLCARREAAARIGPLRAEAGLRWSSLAEENSLLDRYASALGRIGTRIALLLAQEAPGPASAASGARPHPAASWAGRRERASPVSRPW
jgi:hypothetical protein